MSKPLSREYNAVPEFAQIVKIENHEIPFACPKATRAMVALMDMEATLGGAASHYGGPAAFAELMSALHSLMFQAAGEQSKPWDQLFNFVNDAGHCENGLYALKANYRFAGLDLSKLKGFRSIHSPLTGHGEAHLFPEGVLLSNGPLGSALPQSQGLAMADALNGNSRVTVTAISDGACMEGEAREALASIPGLASRGLLAPYVLIISDNNTKLTGRIDQDAFSMAPTFNGLKALGWKVIDLLDGHDLAQCYLAIRQAIETTKKNPKTPVAIHARTIKGIGHTKSAESKSGGHGFPLKKPSELFDFLSEIYDGEALPAPIQQWCEELNSRPAKNPATAHSLKRTFGVKSEKIQVGVSDALIELKKAGLPLISVTSDLPGSTGVQGFRSAFPEASFDVGVAEANMVSVAAGMSKAGMIPVVDTFAQFGVTKGALPLTMANLSLAPVVAFYSHTGFQDAADGASHQALSYLAMTLSIPHLRVFTLTCSEEAYHVVKTELQRFQKLRDEGKTPESVLFFLGRENFPANFGKVSWGNAPVFFNSHLSGAPQVLLLGLGSMLQEALIAQEILELAGVASSVGHIGELVHFKTEPLLKQLREAGGRLAILEDHQMIGGFANHCLSRLLAHDAQINRYRHYAVSGVFGQSAYSAQELYAKHQIDGASVARRIQQDFMLGGRL